MGHTLPFELLFGKHRGATGVLVIIPNSGSVFAEQFLATELNIYHPQILDVTASDCVVSSSAVIFHWEN